MPYFHAIDEGLPLSGFGCGPGCACRECSAARKGIRILLGEPPTQAPAACAPSAVPERKPQEELKPERVACPANRFDVVARAVSRALEMLNNTIDELERARNAVCAGATPAWPLLGDVTIEWLRERLGICIDDLAVWHAGSRVNRSVAEVMRRLMAVRNLIGSRFLRYSCGSPQCGATTWAFVIVRDGAGNCLPGTPQMLIRLCPRFFVPGIDPRTGNRVTPEIHAEFQAQTIIHEASHLTHCNPEIGRGASIGIAECVSQFVAATNGSPIDCTFANSCARTTRCGPAGAAAPDPCARPAGAVHGLGFAQANTGKILAVSFRPENAVRFKGRPAMRR